MIVVREGMVIISSVKSSPNTYQTKVLLDGVEYKRFDYVWNSMKNREPKTNSTITWIGESESRLHKQYVGEKYGVILEKIYQNLLSEKVSVVKNINYLPMCINWLWMLKL